MMTVRIHGVDIAQSEILKLLVQTPRRFGRALRVSGEIIMAQSKSNFVPVDTGALKSSGRVGRLQQRGTVLTVALRFGGASSGYALEVHETNKNYHGGRVWKYLETPAKAFNFDKELPPLMTRGVI